jgi:transcriptional regulator with XRE-family HTH domain
MQQGIERHENLLTAVGSGGSLSYDLAWQFESTYGHSLLRGLAGAAIVAVAPAFFAPSAAGATLVFKNRLADYQSPQWIREPAPQTYALEVASDAPWREQLLRVKDILQLTVADLARFAGVERPSVYHWLSGSRPRSANQRRIDALEHLARFWAALGLGPVRAYLTRTVESSRNTLEAMLTQDDLDLELIQRHVGLLARSIEPAARARSSVSDRMAARGFGPASKENYRRQRAGFVRSTSSGEE